MDLRFTINENLLIACALFTQRGSKLEGWTDLKNRLWDKYHDPYNFFLHLDTRMLFAFPDYKARMAKIADQIAPFFDECRRSPEYKQLLKETQDYKVWLEGEWNTKKKLALQELSSILRIALPKEALTVQVVVPIVGGGTHLGDKNIMWGHTEDWNNYSVVYLLHEALHHILGETDLAHAVTELVTDNELRIRLNGNGEYLFINGSPVGHEKLLELEKKLLPYWNKYIDDTSSGIHDFLKQMQELG